jgi:biotin carboxylase
MKMENNQEFRGKKLLVLGGITLACDIVRHAQAMGVYVVVADYDRNSPAKKIADKAVLIDALDVDAIVELCKLENIDGVTTGFVDILLAPCYEVCKRLGLSYYVTPKMLTMSTNKIDFKDTCDKYDVPVPKTYLVGDLIPVEMYDKVNYPVFVKPLDGSGSRGAGVCNNEEELNLQFKEAVSYSSTNKAIIEDYITGRDFLLDYIAVDGEFRLLSMFDRYVTSDRGSAVNYANISMAPSKAIDIYLDRINDKVINMFKDLGFKDGLLFMQGYTEGNQITFFEMGCRLGGSFYNHEKKCIGYDPVDMIIRYALVGKMVYDINVIDKDIAKYNHKYALDCNYLLKGSDETVSEIKGIEEVKNLPSCISTIQYHEVGYHYTKDRTVDKPIFTAEIVVDNVIKVKEDVAYINNVFDVLNERGESILINKFDPEQLFD